MPNWISQGFGYVKDKVGDGIDVGKDVLHDVTGLGPGPESGIKIPTKATGNAGPNLKTLTGFSMGQISDGNVKKNATDLFKGRRLIVWEIPYVEPPKEKQLSDAEQAQRRFVQMYINPQNLQVSSRKLISEVRTKGGYISQYWGEELETVNIQGTTGDAGIEGINVLKDIYRSEQYALLNIIKRTGTSAVKRRQSLMQLAASVIMWYDQQGLMGYFTDFSYTESAQKPGVFDYQLNFKVTRVIGQRQNFMPWHRRPHSTAQVPFKLDEIGTGLVDGDLNVPPIADIQPDGDKNKYIFQKTDPRDHSRGYDDVKRYNGLDNFGTSDLIWHGIESVLGEKITDGLQQVVDLVDDPIKKVGGKIGHAVGETVGAIGHVAGEVGEGIGDVAGAVGSGVKAVATTVAHPRRSLGSLRRRLN